MPRIVYVPNIMEPHKREILECRVGYPVARILPEYLDFKRCVCIHRGKIEQIDLFAFKFEDEFDELIVRVVPQGIGEAIFGITAAATAAGTVSTGAIIGAAAINLIIAAAASFAIGQLVNLLLPAPKTKNSGYDGESTPNYGWDGIQNTNQNGMPIQIVYGKHKVAGQYLATYTDAEDDGTSTLSMLVGLCAGQASAINGYTSDQTALAASACGDGLKVDGNDGTLFSGMTVSYRRGAVEQAMIPGFSDVVTQYDASQEIELIGTSGVGYVYTTTTDVQAAEVMLSFPSGLYRMSNSGAVLQYDCTLRFRYREDNSSSSWSAVSTETYSAKTRSRWNASHRIDFPHHGKYQIEVARVTEADTSLKSSAAYVTGVKEIEYDDIAYRGVALVGVKAVASEQLNGRLPGVTSLVHGKKVVVYHPDDDFGADTEQTISADGEALWGWYAANTAKADSIATNDYAAHTLSVLHGAATSDWDGSTVTAPYVYKEVTGNFDVRVRAQMAGALAAGNAVGLVCRSQDDATDWIALVLEHDGSDAHWAVRDTTDGVTTDYLDTDTLTTDTYLRLVRSGTTYTAYTSANGTSWTERAEVTHAGISATVDLGLVTYADTSTAGTHRATFSGFSFEDTTAYSTECNSNPAWVIYDLLTDTHYGIGSYVDTTQIDTDSFIDFADYCNTLVSDGENGTHRRHRFDGVIDAQRGAWETVNRIAENSRAAVLKQADKIRVLWQAASTAVQLFAMSNIKAGSWSQVYQSPESGGNYWEVQFLNDANDYEQDYATYIDTSIPAGEPYRRETVSAYGITRQAEAIRKAMWHCKANRYLKHAVSFETGLDAIACEPGDRIEIQHDVPQWGHGGRVVSSGNTSVELNKSVTLAAGSTYQVMVRHSADDTIETRTIQDAAGTYYTLTVLPAWTSNPAADDVWAVGVSAVVTKPFVVSSIKRSGDLECSIEAIEYVEDAYDDEIDTIEQRSYTELTDPRSIPDEVSDLKATERAQILNDGTIRNVIDVTFGLPVGATRANVYWREHGLTAWEQAGRPYGTQYTIESGVAHGVTYDVCVAAVSTYGVHRSPDACSVVTITVLGKTTPPSDVTGLVVTLVGERVYMRWTAVTDADLGGYEVRYGASTWETCTILGQCAKAEYACLNVAGGRETYYQVKAFNTSGIYSATAAWVLETLPERYGENLIVERDEVVEGWDGVKVDTEVDGSTHLVIDQTQTAPATDGTYETPVIDCGASVRPLVSVMSKISQSYAGLTWAGATFAWGSATAQSMTWGGPAGESHISATLQFRYGDALDTAGNVDGTYATFQVGEYSGRYFQFKLTLTVDSAQYNAVVEEMVTKLDVPDLLCSATNVAISGSGSTTITYTTAATGFSGFHVAPDFVAVPYNPANPGDFVRVDAVSATTATVRYYNAAGSQTAGACNFIAKGY